MYQYGRDVSDIAHWKCKSHITQIIVPNVVSKRAQLRSQNCESGHAGHGEDTVGGWFERKRATSED